MEVRGNLEYTTEAEGSAVVGKLLAKFLFNVTNNTGLRAGTLIQTQTATTAYSASNTIATSANGFVTTRC